MLMKTLKSIKVDISTQKNNHKIRREKKNMFK